MNIYPQLKPLHDALKEYRGDGRGDVLFDSRDHGNYGGYYHDKMIKMFERLDPTGVAYGLMLREMVEATIVGAKTEVASLLRDPDKMARLRKILDIEKGVAQLVAEPARSLTQRLTASLKAVSEEYGVPENREIAICLRDAIFCIDKGLSMRWLQCDDVKMDARVPLANSVDRFSDIGEFIDALRNSLPMGVHLARVGNDKTAIGIKQPGRIAFLSSMVINEVTGSMNESLADNSHMAESFDLDTMVQRYPKWKSMRSESRPTGGSNEVADLEKHEIDHLSKLPRDRLIWLAMVAEMSIQRMMATKPGSVPLVESLARALPGQCTLPVVIKPNMTVRDITVEEIFDSMEFSAWEQEFLRPALDGLGKEVFLPQNGVPVGINIVTRNVFDWPKREHSFYTYEQNRLIENAVAMVAPSMDMIGTREEMERMRRNIMGTNMANYLIEWGNHHFTAEWKKAKAWYIEKISENLKGAMHSSVAGLQKGAMPYAEGTNFYTQNPKRKGYDPRCISSSKREVTHSVTIAPRSEQEILEVTGLTSATELPEFLRGWDCGDMGWTISDRSDRDAPFNDAPFNCSKRWDFARSGFGHPGHDIGRHVLHAAVCINIEAFPELKDQMEMRERRFKERAGWKL